MVKGITRQVIVVKGPDPKLFEQAIFLVREDALAEGGVSEEALLEEARMACRNAKPPLPWTARAIWAACGAAVTGFIWILTMLF